MSTFAPKPWLAALLNLFINPLGLLYAGQGRLAILFFVLSAVNAVAGFVSSGNLILVSGLIQLILLIAGAVIAYRRAKANLAQPRPWYARWRGLAMISVATVLVVMLARLFLYEPFKAPSSSMMPTIRPGDRILVQKIGYGHVSTYGMHLANLPHTAAIARGDLIVFDMPLDPAESYVKRVVGVPGDRVVYRDGHLFVNGSDTRTGQLGDFIDPNMPQTYLRYRNQIGSAQFETLSLKGGTKLKPYPEREDLPFIDRCVYTDEEVRCEVPAGHYYVMGDNRDNSRDSRYFGFVRADQVIGKIVGVFRGPDAED